MQHRLGLILGGTLVAIAATLTLAIAREPEVGAPPHDVDIVFADYCPVGTPHRFYPREAVSRGVSGDVTLDCALDQNGDYTSCRIVRERPRGWGFGAAALQVACAYKRPPTDEHDGNRYTLNVPFKLR